MERQFNHAAGFTAKDDDLPPRLKTEPAKTGPAKGLVNGIDKMLPEYYEVRGWSRRRANNETLQRLGPSAPDRTQRAAVAASAAQMRRSVDGVDHETRDHRQRPGRRHRRGTVAQAGRSADDIVLLGDEPEPPYSRMAIPYLLIGNIDEHGHVSAQGRKGTSSAWASSC